MTHTLQRAVRRAPAILAALALTQALSCKDSDSVVRIAVDGPAALPALTSLRASLSNAGATDTKIYPQAPGGSIALPTAFTVTIPHQRAGSLDIALDGLNAQGTAVASGAGTVALRPGDTVSVTITLAAGAALCGNGVLDGGEQCDDGDRFTNGTCDFLCRRGGGAGGAGGTSVASGGVTGTGTGGHTAGGSGGVLGSGGAPITPGTGGRAGGGATGSGGRAAGGAPGSGGVTSTGGSPVPGSGGAPPPPGSGGVTGTGGVVSTGGSGSGGRGSGGVTATGGAPGTGGAAGMPASGGTTGVAGTPGSGGVSASGGVTGAGGDGTACAGELLVNGGFEEGSTGWTATSASNSAIIYPRSDAGLIAQGVTPASGDYLAWLGRDSTGGDDILTSQPINLSNRASNLLLQGLVRIGNGPAIACTANCPPVTIEAQNGAAAQLLRTWMPGELTNSWTAFSVPISDGTLVNGSVLILRLAIPTGGAYDVFFDSLSLMARACN